MQPTPSPNAYEPGSKPMPPFPPGYVEPVRVADISTLLAAGDVERLRGGSFYCDTYYERDNIPALYRREGITTAYVKEDLGEEYPGDSFWYLRDGIENDCWVLRSADGFNPATGGLPSIIRGGKANPMSLPSGSRYLLS